ncbi:MAG: hypothetical protein MJ066_02465 [Clostridia bacterium]|nr:hypothetical protein [Clostridia bacterium]
MVNILTTKELSIATDLLYYEQQAIKKAKLYSKTLTDPTLSNKFKQLAKSHEERFKAIYNLF